jgi:hypothetical protein
MSQLRDAMRAAGAEVWAFGPPSFASSERAAGAEAVFKMMHAVFSDHLIDLRPLTKDMAAVGTGGRASDGIHFTAAGGRLAGARMVEAMNDGSMLPTLLLLAILVGVSALLR